MISLVNSSDPSCSSSKVSGYRADGRDCGELLIQEADPVLRFSEAQISNFSIRNHVFTSRNKNIGQSWPFSSELLQFCMKHDLQALLPPFESPFSVRARTGLFPPLENNHPSCELDKIDSVNVACQTNDSMLRLNPGVIPEDILAGERDSVSTTSTASDIMASKVCPVCKTFSSTSNTTLNAHMDQCLSMESYTMPMLKAKPKKKRLMEDIYSTAPCCTLEDLDRRNGSTWATDLSAKLEPKRTTKLLRSDDEDGKTEGMVYVDSNGIKLRILSKLNEAPCKEEFSPRKNFKSVREGKMIFLKENTHFSTAYSKKMKIKLRNKKLSSLKFFKYEDQAGPSIVHHEESHVDGEASSAQLSREAGRSFNYASATLKSWPSSKRSDLLKKVGKKDLYKIMENPQQGAQMEVVETRSHFSTESQERSSHKMSSASISTNDLSMKLKSYKIMENSQHGTQMEVVETRSHFSTEIQEGSSHKLVSEGISTNDLSMKLKSYASPKRKFADLSPISLPNADNQVRSSQKWSSEGISTNDLSMKSKSYAFPRTNIAQNGPLLHKTKRMSTLSGLNACSIMFRKQRSLLSWTDRKMRKHNSVEAVVTRHHQDGEDPNDPLPQGSTQWSDIISKTKICQNVGLNTSENNDVIIDQDKDQHIDNNNNSKFTAQFPESGFQGLLHNHEKQAPDKAVFYTNDRNACFTGHGGLVGVDISRENSAIFPFDDPLVPNHENKVSSSRQPSVSPASSGSTFSPSSPKHYHFKDSTPSTSEPKSYFPSPLIAMNNGTRGMIIDRNQPFETDFTMQKPHQPTIHHCCCSCQSPIAGNMKPLPNFHFIPNVSFYSNSNLRADLSNGASMESPTDSILTRAYSDVSTTGPSCGTPTPSSSNSIIRLMGKDLMVMHDDESAHLPKVHHPVTNCSVNAHTSSSPLSLSSYTSAFSSTIRNQSSSMITSQAHNCLPDFHQGNMNHKAHTSKEVILIKESDALFPHNTMFQRQFSYLPPYLDNGAHQISQGSPFPAPHFPRPFAFPSPSESQMNSQFYYPQSLR